MGIITSALAAYRTNVLQQQVYYDTAIRNHDIIDNSDATLCCKSLQHYFEVINNNGKTRQYTDNLPKLLKYIQFLQKSRDEQLCYNILKTIDIITMSELLESVAIWDINHPDYITQLQLVSRADNWPKNIMLGQLWILYCKKIYD